MFLLCRRRRQVSPNRWHISTNLHGITYHNTVIRICHSFENLKSYGEIFFSIFSLFIVTCSGGGTATRLRTGRSGVGIPAGERCFSLLQNVHTASVAYPASYSMNTAAVFREEAVFKWPRCDRCYSPPPSAEVKNTWSYTSNPPSHYMVLERRCAM